MKKTIKEDQKRLILKSEMINDNALLEYTADQGKMIILFWNMFQKKDT